MCENRFSNFVGAPYKTVSCPKLPSEGAVTYSEVFGNETEDLQKILESTLRYCRAHNYCILNIYASENDTSFLGKAVAKTSSNSTNHINMVLAKPRKVTLEEIEAHFGYPVEII